FNYREAMLTLAARKVGVIEQVDERHRQQRAQIKRKNMDNRAVRRIAKKQGQNEPRLWPGFDLESDAF
ncbi:hypothetical protein, partial [Chromobacterium haemolyticum]|uniref:hypothetical protein n=1 Tax=Chromobacterium haemolyticum TaxID=394935 RepID=UPI000584FA46